MKNLLSILLLFVSAALLGQADTIPVDNSIDGGYGVSVFSGKPGASWPGDTSRYTQIAYDKVRNILWGYDRNSESNVMLARELAFLADIGDTTTIGSSYNGMLAWAEDVQALYVRKQTGWELLFGGGSVTSVNAQTGVVVLDADDIDDSATTNKFTTAGDISKLAGIESNATGDQTATEIKDALETLSGVSRLDAAYIQNDTVTRMVNDSIIGYFVDGIEVGRDTIPVGNGGGSGITDGDKGDILVSESGSVWSLSIDTLFSISPLYEVPQKPTRPTSFDYYISTTGSNDSIGTGRLTAWADFTELNTLLGSYNPGTVDTIDILIQEGTYNDYIKVSAAKTALTVWRIWTEGTVVIDRGGSIVGDDSGISCNANNNEFWVIGPITVQDINNNCFGVSGDATTKMYIFDAHAINGDDGFSAHSSSKMYVMNSTAEQCGKYAVAQVNSSDTYHYNSTFISENGATGGLGLIESGATGYFYNCTFLPDPGTTSTPMTNQGVSTYENCWFGRDTMSGTWGDLATLENATIRYSYLNVTLQNYLDTRLEYCYGDNFSIRPRGPITDTLTIAYCVFTGPNIAASNRFSNFNFFSSPGDIGGVVNVYNSILTGYTDVFYGSAGTSATHVDTAWTIENNLLINNTNNFVNVTDNGFQVTSGLLGLNGGTGDLLQQYVHLTTSTADTIKAGIGEKSTVFDAYALSISGNSKKMIRQSSSSSGGGTYTASQGIQIVGDDIRTDFPNLSTSTPTTGDYVVGYRGTTPLAFLSDEFGALAGSGLRKESGIIKLGSPSGNYESKFTNARWINTDGYRLTFRDSLGTSANFGLNIGQPISSYVSSSEGLGFIDIKADFQSSRSAINIIPHSAASGGTTAVIGDITFWGHGSLFGTRKSKIRGYGVGSQNSLAFRVNNGDANEIEALQIRYDGNIGIGLADITAPSAKLHLPAGTTSANTSSLKINEGSAPSTPEDGAINHVSNNLVFDVGSTRFTLAKTLTNNKTIDFANITTGNATTDTITVTGAAVGDNVVVSGDVSIPSLGILKAEVTSTDTVTVTYINLTGSDSDLASGTFRATVIKY